MQDNTQITTISGELDPTKPLVSETKQQKSYIEEFILSYDPKDIIKHAEEENNTIKRGDYTPVSSNSNPNLIKALTLNEFNIGVLASAVVGEIYKTFVIDLMRKFQEEYNCTKPSEKTMCEFVAINYVRTLEIQQRLNNALSLGITNDNIIKFIATMSKELDRANRHYLTAIQTLRMMKQAPMQITVKANTAIVGQNQIIQANNKHE